MHNCTQVFERVFQIIIAEKIPNFRNNCRANRFKNKFTEIKFSVAKEDLTTLFSETIVVRPEGNSFAIQQIFFFQNVHLNHLDLSHGSFYPPNVIRCLPSKMARCFGREEICKMLVACLLQS
jgi:hypothetical protein